MDDRINFTPNRRDLLAAAITLAAASICPPAAAAGTRSEVRLGNKKIRTISDGNLVLPVSFVLPDIDKDERTAFLLENGLSADQLSPECNLTLVEDGARKILFDAGSGTNFMPSAGLLPEALDNIGLSADAITDVMFTHGHPDHLWGILDDFDEIAFPEAALHFPHAEWDFWRSEDVVARMTQGRETFAVGAQNRLAAIEDRVQLFDAGNEIVAGIEAVDTSGHTPGHTSFAVHGGSDSVMIVGDALTNHAISFLKPDWRSGTDQDPEIGAKTRRKLLDRLSTDNTPIIGFHLPDGGFGRAERVGNAYRFVQE